MGLCDLNHRKQSCRKPGCKQLCQMDQTSAQQPSLLKEGPMDVKAKAHSLTPVTLTAIEQPADVTDSSERRQPYLFLLWQPGAFGSMSKGSDVFGLFFGLLWIEICVPLL
ncbi:uncharacterized protein ACIBXB_012501 isoform 1-T1 [Morphnus guianensis]